MKISSIVICTIFVVVTPFAVAQEPQKPVLVEEWNTLTCEMIISTIDRFFAELARHQDSSGLVVLTAPPDRKLDAVTRQAIIEYQTKWRNFDNRRFRYVRAKSDNESKAQFWLIPPGAKSPDVSDVDMTYTLPRTLKPFMLGSVWKYAPEACPDTDDAKIFAMFLQDNPLARGNIVVRAKSLRLARSRAISFARRFQKQYGVDANRLRTFHAVLTQPRGADEAIMEYWYLP